MPRIPEYWPEMAVVYPGIVPVPNEVSSLEDGPGECCQHSVRLEAHLPGLSGWVKTKPLMRPRGSSLDLSRGGSQDLSQSGQPRKLTTT